MKKIVVLFLVGVLSATGNIFCDEEKTSNFAKDSFLYGSLGVLAPSYLQPVLGLGFRGQSGHNGFNTIFEGTFFSKDSYKLSLSLDYLYFNKPCLQHQFYFGLGLQASICYWTNYYKTHNYSSYDLNDYRWIKISSYANNILPELIFGKQYVSNTGGRRFFEVKILPFADLLSVYSGRYYFISRLSPSVVLRYGVAF